MLFAGQNHEAKTTFSITNGRKKEKRKQSRTKKCNKRGVYQCLGVTVKSFYHQKTDFDQEQRAEHPFAGQNTQHMSNIQIY